MLQDLRVVYTPSRPILPPGDAEGAKCASIGKSSFTNCKVTLIDMYAFVEIKSGGTRLGKAPIDVCISPVTENTKRISRY